MILPAMKNVLCHLLGGETGLHIASIGFGTSNVPSNLNDTSLTNPFIKAVSGVSYPNQGELQVEWVLTESEANGMAISELGLYAQDGQLLARKVLPAPIMKEGQFRLSRTWTIRL